jgi:hypothetical protein
MKWPIETKIAVLVVWIALLVFVTSSWILIYSLIMKDLDMLPYALSVNGVSIVIVWITGIWSE